jgi:hypothetical protein
MLRINTISEEIHEKEINEELNQNQVFEIHHITCDNCFKILSAGFNDGNEYFNIKMFITIYDTQDGIFCDKCVGICRKCSNYNDGYYIYCYNCQINRKNCLLIKNTYNNITSTLPIELVNQIVCYL